MSSGGGGVLEKPFRLRGNWIQPSRLQRCTDVLPTAERIFVLKEAGGIRVTPLSISPLDAFTLHLRASTKWVVRS